MFIKLGMDVKIVKINKNKQSAKNRRNQLKTIEILTHFSSGNDVRNVTLTSTDKVFTGLRFWENDPLKKLILI